MSLSCFWSTLSNDDSDHFLLLYFSGESVSVVSPPSVFSVIFIFPLIAFSSMISLTISMTKILLGVPLLSLLFIVYVRIRISTKEFEVNTQQVLAVSALTGKPLRLHRPSRFASCLPDWVPDSMADTWIKASILSWMTLPKQQTVLLDEHKGLFVFFVNKRFPCPLLASLGNWKEGGARLPQDFERLEESV